MAEPVDIEELAAMDDQDLVALTIREVVHEDYNTIRDLLEDGLIDYPSLMHWNDWQAWRKLELPQRRPRMRRDGLTIKNPEEYAIYERTMFSVYGDDWKASLAQKEAAVSYTHLRAHETQEQRRSRRSR